MEKIDISQVEMNPFTSIGLDDFLLSAGDESGWNTMNCWLGWHGVYVGKALLLCFCQRE